MLYQRGKPSLKIRSFCQERFSRDSAKLAAIVLGQPPAVVRRAHDGYRGYAVCRRKPLLGLMFGWNAQTVGTGGDFVEWRILAAYDLRPAAYGFPDGLAVALVCRRHDVELKLVLHPRQRRLVDRFYVSYVWLVAGVVLSEDGQWIRQREPSPCFDDCEGILSLRLSCIM